MAGLRGCGVVLGEGGVTLPRRVTGNRERVSGGDGDENENGDTGAHADVETHWKNPTFLKLQSDSEPPPPDSDPNPNPNPNPEPEPEFYRFAWLNGDKTGRYGGVGIWDEQGIWTAPPPMKSAVKYRAEIDTST